MTNSYYKDWDRIYREYPVESWGWELGKPRKTLVDLVENGKIKRGNALDICCGVGTNTVFLAERGFEVSALDISRQAMKFAKQKAREAKVEIQFALGNFVMLPFKDGEFDFVLDIGCFHHVVVKDRERFIQGVFRVLKQEDGCYLLVCFSDRNGPAWNHFSKEQVVNYFSDYFQIKSIDHIESVEGDGVTRFFYTVLMQKRL